MATTQLALDTSAHLTFERAFYVGSYLTAILYGMHLVVFFLSNYFFLASPDWRKESMFYICYGTIMLLLWTVAHSCNAAFGMAIWIEHRDALPGGPEQWMDENLSAWFNTLGTTAGIAMNLMADALLLYRCFIICGLDPRSRRALWFTFPLLVYFGAMAMAILLIYESAIPGASFFSGNPVSFGVPYVALTLSLNVMTTIAICARLLTVRRKVRSVLGDQHCQTYTGVVAVMLESALPFTALGIVYAVAYARNSDYSFAVLQVWADFCAISPQLIILRVALGKAWSKQTVATVSVLVFDHRRAATDTEKVQYHNDTELDIRLPRGRSHATDVTASTLDSVASNKPHHRGIAL
nr:predicted protein [Mycena chlorophos]